MDYDYKIVDVTAENLENYPQVVCYTNKKHPYHHIKIDWIKNRFQEGLKIKLLFLEGMKRSFGFIEYIPGENCWRGVKAEGYMFIHCLWTSGKKFQHQGLGSLLIKEVEKDAVDMKGVAVMVSDKSFMADKNIFLKNDYKITSEAGSEQLLVKQFTTTDLPTITDNKNSLNETQDLTIFYSDQCPWVSRLIRDIEPVLKEKKLKIDIRKITAAAEAQQAPTPYSVFNLIYKGKILSDRYISVTRFNNILKKENIQGERS